MRTRLKMSEKISIILLSFLLAINLLAVICPYKVLFVPTDSMLPTIKPRSLILVEKTNDYEVNGIFTYRLPGTMITITHRLVDITEDGCVFKGDNNDTADEAIDSNRIVYRYIKTLL